MEIMTDKKKKEQYGDNKIDIAEFHKQDVNFLVKFMFDPMSGVESHIFWTNNDELLKELREGDYSNIVVPKERPDYAYELIELIDY